MTAAVLPAVSVAVTVKVWDPSVDVSTAVPLVTFPPTAGGDRGVVRARVHGVHHHVLAEDRSVGRRGERHDGIDGVRGDDAEVHRGRPPPISLGPSPRSALLP